MHLSIVEVCNFRSLKSLRVELQPGLNVLVGRNNTGKTNLLNAIRQALGPCASRGDALWLERDDFFKESADDQTEQTISITLTFTGLSAKQRAYFFEIVDFDMSDLTKSRAIIRFEASWPKNKKQALIKRTGGPVTPDTPEVPTKLLESLPITFLPALRDAEAALTPGVRSRLARLLQDLASRMGDHVKTDIEAIYTNANTALEQQSLISDTITSLKTTTEDLAGSDHCPSTIQATEIDFDRILRSLQVQMVGTPIGALDANGLGYNNLLYMAVVLEHLNKASDENECPLLIVEEPEAHLHPQLTVLLADYLSYKIPGTNTPPQTIVTTHSPTLAASVPPARIHVLFNDIETRQSQCKSIASGGMDEKEQHQLQRMMDIARATLYFAKAAILVEGISESLLIPVLAKRLGYDLSKLHISVIPICGVAFETFKKILDPNVIGIPVAIVTDADPIIIRGDSWEADTPQRENGRFPLSDRTKKLLETFDENPAVQVFHSELTLEYDLADAGDNNALVMSEVWESCFTRTPGTFNRRKVESSDNDRNEKAMIAWRGICRAEHTGSKAEFAHRLAAHLAEQDNTGEFTHAFNVPEYLNQAISYVVESVSPSAVGTST